jgi:hypothetical protein
MAVAAKALFTALSVSDTAAHSSIAFDLLESEDIGVQLVTTGTLTGTWKLEASNDGGTTWTDLVASFSPTVTQPAGSATAQWPQLLPLVAAQFRVTFTASSGSGTITAAVARK